MPDTKTVKFRIQVRSNKTGREWWEDQERYVGQPGNIIRGYGRQPDFNGDIEKFGRDLIDWFNSGCDSKEDHRTFLAAEMLDGQEPPKVASVKEKKVRFILNEPQRFERKGKEPRTHYIRAWKEGRGRSAEVLVQVWLDKCRAEGEPDGDWAMPALLGEIACVQQAVLQTENA